LLATSCIPWETEMCVSTSSCLVGIFIHRQYWVFCNILLYWMSSVSEEPAASIFKLEATIKFLHSIPGLFQYITMLKPIFNYVSKGESSFSDVDSYIIIRKLLDSVFSILVVFIIHC
jgi:hypothetical protein